MKNARELYRNVMKHYNGDNIVNQEMKDELLMNFMNRKLADRVANAGNYLTKAYRARTFKGFERAVEYLSDGDDYTPVID